MRLIDAEKLIMHLSDYALQEAPMGMGRGSEVYEAIQECIRAVEEAETVRVLKLMAKEKLEGYGQRDAENQRK